MGPYVSVLNVWGLGQADRLSKHHERTESAPGVAGCDRTGEKRGKLREVTQPS